MHINELLDAKLLEQHKNQQKRDYLGASMLGDDCARKVQLQYLKHETEISAQNLRTFAIGHHLEDLIVEWLRMSGFSIDTRDENGEQFGFSVAGGKIAGHVDGVLKGGPDCCKYPALLEIKTMSNKSWNDTTKRGVLVSKPGYYVQIQLYMAYMCLDENPCLLTALNKDTSEMYHELVPFDIECAQRYSDRAVQDHQSQLMRRIDAVYFKRFIVFSLQNVRISRRMLERKTMTKTTYKFSNFKKQICIDMVFSKNGYAFFIENTMYICMYNHYILSIYIYYLYTLLNINTSKLIERNFSLYTLLILSDMRFFWIEISVSPGRERKSAIRLIEARGYDGSKIKMQNHIFIHI